jgi:hypothetical protein
MNPMKSALLAALLLSPFATVQAQTCTCEHLGSQYDGLCEANPQQDYYYNDANLPMWRYEWIGTGWAQFPWPNDPFSNFGYYDCPPHKSCGMRFRLFYRFPPLAGYTETYVGEYPCALGTGGG